MARLLHLRDIPHSSLLQRLQALCHAHQVSQTHCFTESESNKDRLNRFKEFTMLSRRYESVSPVGDHPCPRYETDLVPPTTHCRPLSSSPGNVRRFDDSGLDEHYEDDFDFLKKKGNY